MSNYTMLENKVAFILDRLEAVKSHVEGHDFSLAEIELDSLRFNLNQANMLANQLADEEEGYED